MSVKRVNLEDFSRELGKWSEASLKQKKEAVISGVAKSISTLVELSPVDTGLYAQSWDMSVQEQSVILGNHAPYAGVIEYGARPFTPPIGPLLAWAKRVLSGGSGDTGQPESNYSSDVWALAKYTQAKIAKYGMQPRHILENAIPEIIKNIREELAKVA